jgi:outer membrane protein insertion porin family
MSRSAEQPARTTRPWRPPGPVWASLRRARCCGLLLLLCAGAAAAQPAPATAPATATATATASAEEPPAPPRVVRRVQLTGTLLPADSPRRVLSFLDIRPGSPWDEQLQSRILRDTEALGYRADADLDDKGGLVLKLSAVRTVRRVFVTGNWPLFEFEILQNLTWRPGYRVPENEFLVADLRKQEQDVAEYLHKNGYYDASARITLEWAPAQPHLVDLRVRVHLNAGLWRLRYDVGTISARGVHLLSEKELRSVFDHCCLWFGRTSTQKINDDFKRLIERYQGKGYPGARVLDREVRPDRRRRAVDISLTVDERKQVKIAFPGRRRLPERDLMGAVTLFRDNYYSANEMDESARNLFRLYQQNGYFEARVSWRWKRRDTSPIEVEFVIEEGPLCKVREVGFVGARARPLSFPEPKLQEVVQTKRYPRLGLIGLGEGGFVTAVQLEQDVGRLEQFYHREGYPAAHVYAEVARSPEALDAAPLLGLQSATGEDDEGHDLFVRFRIDEGPREMVAQVAVELAPGPQPIDAQTARRTLRLGDGMPYTDLDLLADKERLERLYRSAGHPYKKIEPHFEWDTAHLRVRLTWRIEPGPLVRFGPILIRGNVVTRDYVIRRDLPFREGDPYSENKLLEARQNLEQRQLFTYVKVTSNPGENAQYLREAREQGWQLQRNPVPVLVEVGERYDSYGETVLYAGASTDNVVFGSAGYAWRNLLGTGAEVEFRGELGVRIQSLSARIADPRLAGQLWRLDVRGFWRNELTYSLGPVTSYGANAEVRRFVARTDNEGRRLPPSLYFFTRLDFTISQLLVPLGRSESAGDFAQVGDQTQAFKLAVGVMWDRRVGFEAPALRKRDQPVPTNPLMPVSGFLLSAQATIALCCAFAPFTAEGSFLTLTGQAMGLRPFGPELPVQDGWPFGMRRFNFKANLRVNYGIPFARTALPIVERFYAGGDTTVRGYYADQLKVEAIRSPLGPLGGEPAYRVVPQGGNIRLLSTIEWEFAITPKILGWPLVGAIFLDTGAIFNSWGALGWNDVRFSVGVTLVRLLTQFGPLSLEYAYPLTLPGQEEPLQVERWRSDSWLLHFPGRIHFNWGIPISL